MEKKKKVFESWSNTPPLQRARVMFKFKELIEKNSDELSKIIVSEHGKVFDDAKGSFRGLEVVEYACGIPQMLKGEFTEKMLDLTSIVGQLDSSGSMQVSHHLIFLLVPMDVPTAIACGNTFVLKPSEKDPPALLD